jgi:hypothetical protein
MLCVAPSRTSREGPLASKSGIRIFCRTRPVLPAVPTAKLYVPGTTVPGLNSIWDEPTESPSQVAPPIGHAASIAVTCWRIRPGFLRPPRTLVMRNSSTPRHWSDPESPLVGFEQPLYHRQLGYGPSYIVGKLRWISCSRACRRKPNAAVCPLRHAQRSGGSSMLGSFSQHRSPMNFFRDRKVNSMTDRSQRKICSPK